MSMQTIPRIHAEIEELSERRVTLWNSLSQGRDPAVVEEIKALDAQLDERWAQIRAERARIRMYALHARQPIRLQAQLGEPPRW